MRRDTPLPNGNPPARRTRLNPVSAKRLGKAALRNETREIVLERDLGRCRAKLEGCSKWATDVHEVLTRARGGSITDPDNCLSLCRNCHSYITTHPKFADDNGWTRRSWSTKSE